MIKIAVVILFLGLTSPAYGSIFRWIDSGGVAHYTNNEDEIPERYRSRAKNLYPDIAVTAVPLQNTEVKQITNNNQLPAPLQQSIPAKQTSKGQQAISKKALHKPVDNRPKSRAIHAKGWKSEEE